ncbi:MAG: ABC-2 family transporter protein [Nitrospinae bacterium]|nr:ABC-2 family transporter protein [Nitrospinota bacterium]
MSPALFLKFVEVSFRKEIAYRFDYFVMILNGFIYVFVFTSLWRTVFAAGGGTFGGFTTKSIISYTVVAMVVRISFSMDDGLIPGRVRDGSVSVDLIRPVSFQLMNLAQSVGYSAFHLFARGLPIFVASAWLFGVRVPAEGLPAAIVSLVLAYLLLFLINFTTSLLAFWFVEIFPFTLLKYGLINLLAGGLLPMDFFPTSVRPLLSYLPFQHIFYSPSVILTGRVAPGNAPVILAEQAAWVAAFAVLSAVMWRAGRNKLVIQGG